MKKIIQDKQLLIRRIFLMCYDVLAVFAASIVALLIILNDFFHNFNLLFLILSLFSRLFFR